MPMEMLIEPELIVTAGGVFRKYGKGSVIFHEGDMPLYFHQVISGCVTMMNIRESGTEFIQGIFEEGQAFGTPALLLNEPFPASAIASKDVVLLRLDRISVIELLKRHPEELFKLSIGLSRQLYHKSAIGKGMASQGPEERIATLLGVLKKESGCDEKTIYRLNLSRQQIGDMIGLRVETVIRAMKKLEEKGLVNIEHGKVFY